MSLYLPSVGTETFPRSILHWRESVTSQTTVSEKVPKAPVLEEFVNSCLGAYSKVLANLSTRQEPHDSLLCSLRSSRDYLVLWADDNGVRDGNLDYIIDLSRRLHALTVQLLIKIGEILVQRVLPRTLGASQRLASNGEYEITVCLERLKLMAQGSSNFDSDSETDESISDAEAEEESLAQISQSLKVTVGCLVGIGPRLKERTVERVKEFLSKPIEIPQWHASIPLIERIRRRYPDCDVDLATRLGEANWRRMEDRKRRIEENEQFPEALPDLDFGANAPEKTILPPTLHDSGIGTSVSSAHSERAETVVSYKGAAGGSIRVPPLPKEARSCEGCGGLVQISNMVEWKKHLFEDLQPYMCLYDSCQSNFSPFQTKAEWLNHFLVDHARNGDHFECPLCKSDEPVGAMSTLKHVSRHLEEIALTALPIDCEYDDDIGDNVSQISSRLENSVHRRSPWDDPDPWVANLNQELLDIEVKVPQSEHEEIHSEPTLEQLRPQSMDHPGGFPCTECRAALPDQASLTKHIKQQHTRPFVCVFHFAGCASTFSNKNEWKRHVVSQHLLLNYWLCQQDGCAKLSNTAGSLTKPIGTTRQRSSNNSGSQEPCSSGLPNGALFNRKDLYTSHLRRMHSPPAVMKQAKAKKPVPEWEDYIRKCQTEAHKLRCALPDYMTCPMSGCGFETTGSTAWDERMEHVAKHLEKAAKGRETQIKFGGDNDPTLMNWAIRPDVAVIKGDGSGGWALNNPLKPERSGKAQTQKVYKRLREEDYDDEKDALGGIDYQVYYD